MSVGRRLLFLTFCVAAVLFFTLPGSNEAQLARTYTLPSKVSIAVSGAWTELRGIDLPPPPPMLASAPDLHFSERLLLENRSAPAIIQLAISDNPYLGRDARYLDETINVSPGSGHALVEHFFYFFFPPPMSCLAAGRARFEREKRRQEREELSKDEKEKSAHPLTPVFVQHTCDYGPTVPEFFAEQIQTSVIFRHKRDTERVEGVLRRFYQPPMEQIEIGRRTFFIFEAQGELTTQRPQLDKYGLREDLVGTRARFLWAIGADTPFPFFKDIARKDVQLVHLVYAGLTLDGEARREFLRLLRSVE